MKKRMFKYLLSVCSVVLITSCSILTPGDLGSNLYLMKGDSKEDEIIVFCANKDMFGCYSGACIIPPKKMELNKQGEADVRYYMEYVKSAKSNKKYVLAKTYNPNDKKDNYWLINKDFDVESMQVETIISTYLTGPLDSVQFYQELRNRNINLRFKEK